MRKMGDDNRFPPQKWYVGNSRRGDFDFFSDGSSLVAPKSAIAAGTSSLIRIACSPHSKAYWINYHSRFAAIPRAFQSMDNLYELHKQGLVDALPRMNPTGKTGSYLVWQDFYVANPNFGQKDKKGQTDQNKYLLLPPVQPNQQKRDKFTIGFGFIAEWKDLTNSQVRAALGCGSQYGVPDREHVRYGARLQMPGPNGLEYKTAKTAKTAKAASSILHIATTMPAMNNCPSPSYGGVLSAFKPGVQKFRMHHFISGTTSYSVQSVDNDKIAPFQTEYKKKNSEDIPIRINATQALTESTLYFWAQQEYQRLCLREGVSQPVMSVFLEGVDLRAIFVEGEFVGFNKEVILLSPKVFQ